MTEIMKKAKRKTPTLFPGMRKSELREVMALARAFQRIIKARAK